MTDPLTLLADLRAQVAIAPTLPGREDWLKRIDALAKALQAQAAQLSHARQEIEDAEHTRDAASLARMRVLGQLNTVHKALAAASADFAGGGDGDAQHEALRRIEWLALRGVSDPGAALAAKEAEMEAPMPSKAVLEAVIAGQRRFSKPQLEFSLSEAIVLTNWDMTPVEIMAKGEPWLAELILSHHAAPEG